MVVEYSRNFIKELKKHTSKAEAKKLLKKLSTTSPSDGDFITAVTNITIREKRLKTFRFYFIVHSEKKQVISKQELDEFLIKFIAMSKKNNQQTVIDKLKEELKAAGFRL